MPFYLILIPSHCYEYFHISSENDIGYQFLTDFKYWDDETDTTRDKEGTLLPLWEFATDKIQKLEVTGICWNHKHKDLFGVSFGSCKLCKIMVLFWIFRATKHFITLKL